MMPLGEWILRQACAGAVKWPAHLRVCGLRHNLDIPVVAEEVASRAIGCSFA